MDTASDSESPGAGLGPYLGALRRQWLVVLALVVIAGGAAYGISMLQQPLYAASTKIVIGRGSTLFQPQNGSQGQPVTATMSDLLQSNVVATNVIQALHLDTSPEHLLDRVHVSTGSDTAVLAVTVDDPDSAQAERIAQEIGLVFSQLVKQRFGSGADGTTTAQALTATVFDPAHVVPGKVEPRTVRNVVAAGVLGLVLGLIAAFLREQSDRPLRGREELERGFGLPVIGQVPFEKRRRRDAKRLAWSPGGKVADAYRHLRANLQYLAVGRPLRTLLVTSAAPEQGTTTVTANLALAIARSGASSIVIDGDLRGPELEAALGVPSGGPGLTSLLVGAARLEDAVRDVEVPADGEGARPAGRLSFLPSGPLPPNPAELLSSARMEQLLARLSVFYDYVLIDSPPLLPTADALELARTVDGAILCVRGARAAADEARGLRALGDRPGVHLVGIVLTDVPAARGHEPVAEPPPSAPAFEVEPVPPPEPRDHVTTDEL